MIKDLTKDEIVWRYENLMEFITDEISENGVKKLPEDEDVSYINDLIRGYLVYLQQIDAINIVLHNEEDVEGA